MISSLALVCCVATIFSFMSYRDVVNKIDASEEFSNIEDYEQTTTILESAMTSWIVKSFGVKRDILGGLLSEAVTSEEDKRYFEDGIDVGSKDLIGGIHKLSAISSDSRYFDQSQIKIGEFRIHLLELELDSESGRAKSTDEENNRLLIANKALGSTLDNETEAKLAAESEVIIANQRTDDETTAKRLAQQQAAEQELIAQEEAAAKRLAQQQAAEQAAIAIQMEKDRVLVLANTHPMIQAVVSGELKFYIEPLPSYAASNVSSGVEDIARVLSAWNPYGATMRRVYSSSNSDLVVNWVKDYGTHVLGESIYKSYIKVGLGTDNCRGDWMAFDADTVKKVLWHEIGHSMGYSHSSDPTNVMYSTTTTHFDVEQYISDTIASGWYQTFPLCVSGQVLYSIESESQYEGFDIHVLPPETDPATLDSGGLVYTDCGSTGMASFSNSCNVSLGASIYITPTHDYNGVTITGEVTTPDESAWPDMDWDLSVFQYEESDMIYYRDLFR